MGLPMSANLKAKGFEVKAYDIDNAVLEKCRENVRK
jgi:3-hydroxyisobutyrate dehydrogenase-like beta-hydroxyacid dehydrogenase